MRMSPFAPHVGHNLKGVLLMRIWLATVGEPLPVDEGTQRLLRTGQFAQWLADRGHEVVFFTGTMDHYARRLRSRETVTYQIAPNYKIVALAGRLYKQSISFSRFRNHVDVARSFGQVAEKLPRPDVILASYPTEELCRAVLNYADPRGIPVAMDARDFWPDIFSEVLPGPLKPLGPLVFGWMERRARETLSRATALSGMTPSALAWAQRKACRKPVAADFWFPFSYPTAAITTPAVVSHEGVNLAFLGTLSHRSNLEVVIDAMRILEKRGIAASLAICGTGQADQALRKRAEGMPSVVFHGWLDAAQLSAIMARSDLGVLPYDRPDFHLSIPNKFVEYLAGGLAVLSCTEGEVQQLIAKRQCGIWVPPVSAEIADAVAALHGDEIQEMRSNARTVFADTFTPDAVFGKAFAALDGLVSQRSAATI